MLLYFGSRIAKEFSSRGRERLDDFRYHDSFFW